MNAMTPTETVLAVLRNATDPATIAALVEPDATYVSPNYANPELRRIMPWCGTHAGSQSVLAPFLDVNRHWAILAFDVLEAFGTASTFGSGGAWTFRADPEGTEGTI